MANEVIHKEAFLRVYAYMLEDKGMSQEEVSKLCDRNSFTVGELISLLSDMPQDHLVFISESGDTETMNPRIYPVEFNFKDESTEDDEGFVLLRCHTPEFDC